MAAEITVVYGNVYESESAGKLYCCVCVCERERERESESAGMLYCCLGYSCESKRKIPQRGGWRRVVVVVVVVEKDGSGVEKHGSGGD
jgi:hypothetical protein